MLWWFCQTRSWPWMNKISHCRQSSPLKSFSHENNILKLGGLGLGLECRPGLWHVATVSKGSENWARTAKRVGLGNKSHKDTTILLLTAWMLLLLSCDSCLFVCYSDFMAVHQLHSRISKKKCLLPPPPPFLPQVSHILNVAFGVENVFPDLFIYKTVSIVDHPDTDVLLHIQDCCDFIQQARSEVTH